VSKVNVSALVFVVFGWRKLLIKSVVVGKALCNDVKFTCTADDMLL